MGGKPHDGVVTTFNPCNFAHSKPFLNAVTSGFVKGRVTGDIILYFLRGECVEMHCSKIGIGTARFLGSKGKGGIDLM